MKNTLKNHHYHTLKYLFKNIITLSIISLINAILCLSPLRARDGLAYIWTSAFASGELNFWLARIHKQR
jgi:hypothetical protein